MNAMWWLGGGVVGWFSSSLLVLNIATTPPPRNPTIPLRNDPTVPVGMPARIENLVLPGSELEVKPLDDRRAKLTIRITSVNKHGTAHRYDLTYYGLEAGTYDLREYVQRKDGTPLGEIPPIVVTVTSILPPGQILPSQLPALTVPSLGGYSWVLVGAGVLWLVVFFAILFVGRKKLLYAELISDERTSLADRLRPLVERGLSGQLSLEERADLERSLLAFWTRRLNLGSQRPANRFARLRADPEAGPLLEQLETWLHKPGPQAQVDVAALLKPYKDLPADALEEYEVATR